jgi:iron complex outermembrane receptor protein
MPLRRKLLFLCLMGICVAASASDADSALRLYADIGAQPVAQALSAFGRQSGLQLIYVSTIAETQQSKGARAGLLLSEALAQLLDGTGLRFEFLNARTVRIYATPAISATPVSAAPVSRHPAESAAFRPLALEEIIVTATRREEQVNRVPIAMTVWTQDAMEASGIKGIAEIGTLTPGVDFNYRNSSGGDFYTSLAIRGVTGMHGTTTGIFLDDSPVPPARPVTYMRSFPVTFDLDRVEVLRGPQGVLLGDHTQGGAVRFIMNQPSLSIFSSTARTEWATTAGGGMSYELGAAVGGPMITDVLGFRVSGWYRSDSGYVDRVDPFTGATVEANSNRYLTKSVRSALMLAPTDFVRITPSLSYQSMRIRDTSTFWTDLSKPEAGVLKNAALLQQPFDETFYLASLKLTAGFGAADLSAVTSYFDRTAGALNDDTPTPYVAYSDAVATHYAVQQRMFSQEARLTSADPNASLTWIVGTFFSSEHVRDSDRTNASWVSGAGPGEVGNTTVIRQSQLSAFGQIALKMTKRLTATAGLRIGRSKYDSITETPPIFHAQSADTWTTPRFVLSYRAGERNLLYLGAAKGYGSGGVYPAMTVCLSNAQEYAPDTLWSYEIGTKHELLGGRMHLDTGVFHIRWNNGDAATGTCEISPQPGTAVSNGFDLAVQALLTEHVRLRLAIAYTDAHFTETIRVAGALIVRNGDAVDRGDGVTPPWNAAASIEREFFIRGGVTVNIRAEDVFHGRNPGPFYADNPASPNYDPGYRSDPSTNLLNLRANVRWSSFDVAAFVNNALDSQPILRRATFGASAATTFTPRTVGLSASWRF